MDSNVPRGAPPQSLTEAARAQPTMPVPATHVVYLHGFRSSPGSFKARHMAALMARHHPGVQWWCPQLPPSPAQAINDVMRHTASWPQASTVVLGSSLGGFYATWLAEQRDWRAVLLNPAIGPARDLQRYVGTHTMWHDPTASFEFKAEYVQEMNGFKVEQITQPQRYYALIAKGDEVLDWREMAAHFANCQGQVLEGGDHALSNFEALLPGVLRFMGLPEIAAL